MCLMSRKSVKRRAERRRSHARGEREGIEWVLHDSPFADLSEDEAGRLLREFGEREEATFADALARVQELVSELDPVHVLTPFAFYYLTSRPGVDRETARPDPVLEHHVEVLQAICLSASGPRDGRPVPWTQLTDLVRSLRDLTSSFNQRRLRDVPEEATRLNGFG